MMEKTEIAIENKQLLSVNEGKKIEVKSRMTKNKREKLRAEIKEAEDYKIRPLADDIAAKIREHLNSLGHEEKEEWKNKTEELNKKIEAMRKDAKAS